MHKCGEKCSQCFTSPPLLWLHSADTEGRVFYIAAFLHTSSLCSNPTHIHAWEIFCCITIILHSALQHLPCCLANPYESIICRTNTVKFMSESHDILCNQYIQSGFMCISVYMFASTNCCTCMQVQAKHGWRWAFRWMVMCGIFQ